jgi:membrane protease YdiL (CAAX protease family)
LFYLGVDASAEVVFIHLKAMPYLTSYNYVKDQFMQQLSKLRAIVYHLYPGILNTIGFIMFAPLSIKYGYSPQFGILLAVLLVAMPLLTGHLRLAKKEEQKKKITDLNGFTNKLPTGKLILYSLGLVVLAFIIWGLTQPANKIISDKLLGWLPAWFTSQDLKGYDHEKIKITLLFNLLLNGLLMPFVEELYFRGYLLPRMQAFGKSAFLINAVFFSLYHFWQPHIYLTLILSLLPMTYLVWKTRDLRLAILTHCLLNLVGAVLSFGLLMK